MAVTAIYGLHLNGNRKANEMREQNLHRPEDIIEGKIRIGDFSTEFAERIDEIIIEELYKHISAIPSVRYDPEEFAESRELDAFIKEFNRRT